VPKHNKGINYSQRLKAIRPFVDFNYDLRRPLSSAAKAKISRYYDYIEKLTVRPHQIYRARSAKNLRAVQRYAQHDTKHKAIKVAFVPNDGTGRVKVRVSKKGQVSGKSGHLRFFNIAFDAKKLAEQGREYVERKIKNGPVAKRYSIQAGEFEVASTYLPPGQGAGGDIVTQVLRHMERYGADKFDPENPSSHYFGNWLFGVNGYNFAAQAELSQYREAKRQATKKEGQRRANKRKAEKRARLRNA